MSGENERQGMRRRDLLKGLIVGASAALPGKSSAAPPAHAHGAGPAPQSPSLGAAEPPDPSLKDPNWKPEFFDEHENETVVVLSDLLIPETDTPGAKAAQVNRFIDMYLAAANQDIQKKYLEALGWLDGYCISKYSKPFVQLDRAAEEQLLALLTHPGQAKEVAHGAELFGLVKTSVVEAYYSSEIGLLQELKYQTNPFQAEFPGCKNPDDH